MCAGKKYTVDELKATSFSFSSSFVAHTEINNLKKFHFFQIRHGNTNDRHTLRFGGRGLSNPECHQLRQTKTHLFTLVPSHQYVDKHT